jgi:thiamine kinase-like enzyme
MISEYLSGEKVLPQDLQSDQLYVALAHLLQKIHHGKAFKCRSSRWDVFKRIDHDLQACKHKCGAAVPIIEVEQMVAVIRDVLSSYQEIVPCHNDLHAGNLIYFGNEFKAIDYGDAGPGEAYFDVATVAADCLEASGHETMLLATYLGREPSAVERSKLYLMEQIVLIKWACDRLRDLSADNLLQYNVVEVPAIEDFFKKKHDLSKPGACLKCFKCLIKAVLNNAEMQEFRDSVRILSEHE